MNNPWIFMFNVQISLCLSYMYIFVMLEVDMHSTVKAWDAVLKNLYLICHGHLEGKI